MDTAREKLVELIRSAHKKCKAHKTCHECEVYGNGSDCVYMFIADHLLASGVTFHGMAELVLDYPLGRDLYSLTPKWRCSHCGFGIEDRSRPPRRFDFLQFCPKCGFMFLPQKEVNDGDDLDAGHG